jgi:hypothetical protein
MVKVMPSAVGSSSWKVKSVVKLAVGTGVG